MSKNYRQGRLSEEIKKTVSTMLVDGIKEPRLKNRMITVSGVEVTNDNSYAYIYVIPLVLRDEDRDEVYIEVLDGFKRAQGVFRNKIAKDYRLHHAPELVFRIDKSEDYGRHIDELLDQIEISDRKDIATDVK